MISCVENIKIPQYRLLAQKSSDKSSKTNSFQPGLTNFKTITPNAALTWIYFAGNNNNPKSKLGFRGQPWKINLWDLGISSYGSITAKDAIKVFEKFKLGNYLDIVHSTYPPTYEPAAYYKSIRAANLEFLDRVTDTTEKKKFIEHYKELTGFPDLKKVSEKIKQEFVRAVKKTEQQSPQYKVLQMGYDGVCSVAKGKAFPGSDLDKSYIIIKGDPDWSYNDGNTVKTFKGNLWKNTDQRILSYNHDTSFPQIYTENQVIKLFNKVESVANNLNLHKPIELPTPFFKKLFDGPRTTTLFKKYQSLMDKYHNDYEEANPFFIKICEKFPICRSNKLDINYPSRENIKNFGFFIESFQRGDKLGNIDQDFLKDVTNCISNSDVAKLTNLAQLNAIKKGKNNEKLKLKEREQLEKDFNSWPIDKQYNLIKNLIKASCDDNNTDFPEYFQDEIGIKDKFTPLINKLLGE